MKSGIRWVLIVAFVVTGGVLAVGLFGAPRRRPSTIDPVVRVTHRDQAVTEPVAAVTAVTEFVPVAASPEPGPGAPRVRRRRPSRKRRVLGLVTAVAILVGGFASTSATFNALTRNPGNVFASGTLVMANTKQAGTTCLSTAGGSTDTNVNNACEQLIGVTVRKPGDVSLGKVTIRNNGSINASALQFYLSNCVSANATGESFNGTGNMCSGVQVYLQEYSDSGFTTKSNCRYGGGTATVCAFDATKTLSALQTAYTSGSPLGLGAQAAGVSDYFEIGVTLPSSADNTFQGRQATFDLNWVMIQ